MKSFPDFLKQYLYENKRIYFVLNAILFILLPVFSGYVAKWRFFQPDDFIASQFMMNLTASFVVVSILIPIYNFRFLYKKSANELYFSLPIQRKQLFMYIMSSGVIAMLIPYLFNNILVMILFLNNTHILFWISSYIAALFFILMVFYSVSAAITVRSNHIFDCIAIGAGYLFLPSMFVSAIQSIVYSIVSHIYKFSIGIQLDEIVPLLKSEYIQFLSPVFFSGEIGQYFYNGVFDYPLEINWFAVIYWLFISAGCFYLAYVSFLKRKAEDSQEITKTFFGYPLLILLFSFTLLCMMNEVYEWLIVFVLYSLAIFYSQRKIKMNLKQIGSFILILACSLGLKYGVYQMDLSKYIQILPHSEDIYEIHINIFEIDTFDDSFSNALITVDNEKDVDLVMEFLDTMLSEKGMNPGNIPHIGIDYMAENKTYYRHFEINEKGIELFRKFLNENPQIVSELY